jgi:hypothetical protein
MKLDSKRPPSMGQKCHLMVNIYSVVSNKQTQKYTFQDKINKLTWSFFPSSAEIKSFYIQCSNQKLIRRLFGGIWLTRQSPAHYETTKTRPARRGALVAVYNKKQPEPQYRDQTRREVGHTLTPLNCQLMLCFLHTMILVQPIFV